MKQNPTQKSTSDVLLKNLVDHETLVNRIFQLLDADKNVIAADISSVDANGQCHVTPQNVFAYFKELNTLFKYRMKNLPNNKIQLIADAEYHLPDDEDKKKELLREYISRSMLNMYEVFYELTPERTVPIIAGMNKPIMHIVLAEARTWLYS